MTKTIITQLAEFTHSLRFEDLPASAVDECKRTILDSIGCALAGTTHPKGKIGIEYGRLFGGKQEATVIGTGDQLSVFGASFANGELINALDFDVVLPPGHVTPYVLPAAIATAESLGASGKDVIVTTALSHEMSYRIGKALDYLRDVKNGKVCPPPVFGYSCTIFGATAAIGKLKGFDTKTLANALGLAGSISPCNTHWAWVQHSPSTTIKYLLAGWLCHGALTAAYMAQFGHRGDIYIMDDEWGFWRFIGSSRWEPTWITTDLGKKWLFPPQQSYKPYPHCRILAAPLDAMLHLVEENDIKPEEIESVKAWVEGFCQQPAWLNRTIEELTDAQFSVAHGLAVAAHRISPKKKWQDPDVVFSPSVLKLMDKITYDVHPDYVKSILENPASRPSKIEIKARGKKFVAERLYPRGSTSPQPATYFTTEELVEKFKSNAEGVISKRKANAIVKTVLALEELDNITKLMKLVY